MSLKPSPESKKTFAPATRLVHAGRDPGEQHGFVNTPIYRGSTVLYPTYDAIKHRRGRYNYGTSATPDDGRADRRPGRNSPAPPAPW